ncbi:MAG: serine/threonine-protein kinase, partial [Acidobacteriota bacterium]
MPPSSFVNASAKRRWQRTEELFHAAGQLAPQERRAFLLRACGKDLDWVEEIEGLLDAAPGVDRHVDGVISQTLSLAAQQKKGRPPGLQQVGPYKILRELGRGGMSTVYLAERSDQHFHKLVAVKVVKRGMDTAEILRRLRQERQILAHLEHRHISRLLDGGNTADGRPYFVMEYVDGEPIDRYCVRLELSVEQRLGLFRDVLAAVAYAHRNLVVHRDLKPANILITGRGEVKLLDFGIAKVLDPERAADFSATAAPLRFFTLDYASPEQILGQPLNTASDVYSLGVLLFELLTGRRPYDGDVKDRGLSRSEKERAICQLDPPRPSDRIFGTGAKHEALRRRLRGDLDAIVRKALERQQSGRYLSVEQFAEDLRRHQQGLPVRACQDTLVYRAGKFLRRHRLAVGGATAAILTLASLVTFHTTRLATERNRAQIERDKSRQVASFLRGLFENADPGRSRGAQVTARDLLAQGAARIAAELADQPDVRAELMDLIGSVYLTLGLYEDADPLLRASEDLRRERFGEQASETIASRLHRGQWLHAVGRYDEADSAFQELLRTPGDGPQWAEILNAYADLLFDLERPEEAETLFRQVLEIRRRLFGDGHALVATSLNDLGAALYARGELVAAEEPLRQALELRRRLLGQDHPQLAITLGTLGVLRFAQGDSEEAQQLLADALAIRRRVYGEEHPSVSDTLNNLGEVCRRRGDLDAAVEYLSAA